MRLTIETQPDGSAAIFELRPTLVAEFQDAALAEAFAQWAAMAAHTGHPLLRRKDTAAPTTAAPAADDVEAAIAALSDADTELAPEPLTAQRLVADRVAARVAAAAVKPEAASETAVVAEPAPQEIATDASPANALPADPPPEEIAPPPLVEPQLDPYHETGEAFRRLKAGEQLGSVADDLRLNMPRLRSRWSNYQKGLKALAWQPGDTVVKPAVPDPALDADWALCPRCKVKFNAAKAQAYSKLPTRPTHCAACRT